MATSSKDERILRGILFDEDRPVSLVEPGDEDGDFYDSPVCKKIDRALDRIMAAMKDDSDALKSMLNVVEAYEGTSYRFDADLPKDVLIRVVINQTLLAVCGWSLPTLLADEFPGDEAKDEEGHGEKQDG
jgi:hypothetical protein